MLFRYFDYVESFLDAANKEEAVDFIRNVLKDKEILDDFSSYLFWKYKDELKYMDSSFTFNPNDISVEYSATLNFDSYDFVQAFSDYLKEALQEREDIIYYVAEVLEDYIVGGE